MTPQPIIPTEEERAETARYLRDKTIDHAISQLRTVPQAAGELGLSEPSIRRIAKALTLGWRPDGRTIILRPADIDAIRARVARQIPNGHDIGTSTDVAHAR